MKYQIKISGDSESQNEIMERKDHIMQTFHWCDGRKCVHAQNEKNKFIPEISHSVIKCIACYAMLCIIIANEWTTNEQCLVKSEMERKRCSRIRWNTGRKSVALHYMIMHCIFRKKEAYMVWAHLWLTIPKKIIFTVSKEQQIWRENKQKQHKLFLLLFISIVAHAHAHNASNEYVTSVRWQSRTQNVSWIWI